MRLCVHAFLHWCFHAFMHSRMHARMNLCIHTFMNSCIHPPIHPSHSFQPRRQSPVALNKFRMVFSPVATEYNGNFRPGMDRKELAPKRLATKIVMPKRFCCLKMRLSCYLQDENLIVLQVARELRKLWHNLVARGGKFASNPRGWCWDTDMEATAGPTLHCFRFQSWKNPPSQPPPHMQHERPMLDSNRKCHVPKAQMQAWWMEKASLQSRGRWH